MARRFLKSWMQSGLRATRDFFHQASTSVLSLKLSTIGISIRTARAEIVWRIMAITIPPYAASKALSHRVRRKIVRTAQRRYSRMRNRVFKSNKWFEK